MNERSCTVSVEIPESMLMHALTEAKRRGVGLSELICGRLSVFLPQNIDKSIKHIEKVITPE